MYRDEFDLAILKMQEDNRLEILKRKWWDGGKCPKEEDHRAKGLSVNSPSANFSVGLTPFSTANSSSCHFVSLRPPFTVDLRSGHGEHWRHLCGPRVRPAGGHLHGSVGVCLDVKADARKRGERGLSNLHLLCLPLPSLAPFPPRGCTAPQLPALRGSAAGHFLPLGSSRLPDPFCPRHNQHKSKEIPQFYLTRTTCICRV